MIIMKCHWGSLWHCITVVAQALVQHSGNFKITKVGIWKWLNSEHFLKYCTRSMEKQRSYFNYLCTARLAFVGQWAACPFCTVCSLTKTLLFENVKEPGMSIHCRATRFFSQTHLCNIFFQEMGTCTWTSRRSPTAIPCWMPSSPLCTSGLRDAAGASAQSTGWASRRGSSFSTASHARQCCSCSSSKPCWTPKASSTPTRHCPRLLRGARAEEPGQPALEPRAHWISKHVECSVLDFVSGMEQVKECGWFFGECLLLLKNTLLGFLLSLNIETKHKDTVCVWVFQLSLPLGLLWFMSDSRQKRHFLT